MCFSGSGRQKKVDIAGVQSPDLALIKKLRKRESPLGKLVLDAEESSE